jgi:hypothetical protein
VVDTAYTQLDRAELATIGYSPRAISAFEDLQAAAYTDNPAATSMRRRPRPTLPQRPPLPRRRPPAASRTPMPR